MEPAASEPRRSGPGPGFGLTGRDVALLSLIPIMHAAIYFSHHPWPFSAKPAPPAALTHEARVPASELVATTGSLSRPGPVAPERERPRARDAREAARPSPSRAPTAGAADPGLQDGRPPALVAGRYVGTGALALGPDHPDSVLAGPGNGATITGHAGANAFTVESGSWRIEGGGGADVLRLPGEASAYRLELTGRTGFKVTGPGGTQTVANVPSIRFAGREVGFDFSPTAARVVRLYDAAFQRAPDLGGGTRVYDMLRRGVPAARLAQALLDSAEGRTRFPPDLAAGAFVDALYTGVLRRPADPAGRANWLRQLASGRSRGWALAAFAESPEHAAAVEARGVAGLALERAPARRRQASRSAD